MKTKNFILTIVAFFLITFIIVFLIRINNDHKECGETTTYGKNSKGNTVISKKHICKEKFCF
ncbi:hypothetical protein Q765_02675 [Flavobacterium rivuli WB 3.3-2 = DSM 21788]|uniref:Uncharacterized protein n=1 Tax=Flavobacterium rivuli WB 3.3-2 = DSM 21788 TaxID=1121895 RepID=A0A0A2M949_9FLAO|nr:hypothetical protein [Flavobacterium rivuli]KGO87988.1 hypothetical protein Q765_02675 [Flavobacterium rivuli WB 3.3-2 = DSM 21788]